MNIFHLSMNKTCNYVNYSHLNDYLMKHPENNLDISYVFPVVLLGIAPWWLGIVNR